MEITERVDIPALGKYYLITSIIIKKVSVLISTGLLKHGSSQARVFSSTGLLKHPTQARVVGLASMNDQYDRKEPQSAYIAYSSSRQELLSILDRN